MYHLYGISNCDTVKKAKKHLEDKNIEYEFHDFKKNILTPEIVKRWKTHQSDWPVNPRGRIFKQLKEEFEAANEKSKLNLILENTSLIKRPVLEKDNKVLILGYDASFYEKL